MKKKRSNWNEGSLKAANIIKRETTKNDMPPVDGQLPQGVLGKKRNLKSNPLKL